MEWPNLKARTTMIKSLACVVLAFSTCFSLFFFNLQGEAASWPFPNSSCYGSNLRISALNYLCSLPSRQRAFKLEEHTSSSSNQPAGVEGQTKYHEYEQVLCKGGEVFARWSTRGDNELRKRRVMMGRLGSMPPSCSKRCVGCTPCKPVHVPVQRRGRKRIGLMEYYPEAWRCKCKNKLYMP